MRPGLHKAHAQMGQEIFLKDLILTMRVQAWCLKQRKEKKKGNKYLFGMKPQNDLL